MQKLDTKTFIAEIVSETSLSPVPTKLGTHESTMDLYYSSAMDHYYYIEWDIPGLDIVEQIGLWCEIGTKKIIDYDGVFTLPNEAIELLKENGFDISEII